MSLIDQYALQQAQLIKLHGELLRAAKPNEHLQARIEFQVQVPTSPNPLLPSFEHLIAARLTVHGHSESTQDQVFVLEVVMNAQYLQFRGEALNHAQFTQRHTDFVRQLYPLLSAPLRSLLPQLGLANVVLPHDLPQVEQDPTVVRH